MAADYKTLKTKRDKAQFFIDRFDEGALTISQFIGRITTNCAMTYDDALHFTTITDRPDEVALLLDRIYPVRERQLIAPTLPKVYVYGNGACIAAIPPSATPGGKGDVIWDKQVDEFIAQAEARNEALAFETAEERNDQAEEMLSDDGLVLLPLDNDLNPSRSNRFALYCGVLYQGAVWMDEDLEPVVAHAADSYFYATLEDAIAAHDLAAEKLRPIWGDTVGKDLFIWERNIGPISIGEAMSRTATNRRDKELNDFLAAIAK